MDFRRIKVVHMIFRGKCNLSFRKICRQGIINTSMQDDRFIRNPF